MIYKIFNVKNLTREMIAEYLPLLSDQKRDRILSITDILAASQALVCEILPRQCLSQLCDAPQSSFQLLVKPDSKSAVTNFDAKISINTCDEYVICAASHKSIGAFIMKPADFSFPELQKNLSDSEIRYLLSDSSFSVTDIIRNKHCGNNELNARYAMLISLKKALFYSSGKVIMNNLSKINFSFSENKIISDNPQYEVMKCEYLKEYNLVCSIVERSL